MKALALAAIVGGFFTLPSMAGVVDRVDCVRGFDTIEKDHKLVDALLDKIEKANELKKKGTPLWQQFCQLNQKIHAFASSLESKCTQKVFKLFAETATAVAGGWMAHSCTVEL